MAQSVKEILAIIPARAGSKGIPGKNIKPLAGKPLLAHTIEQALGTKAITRVVVSTDGAEIGALAEAFGAEVIWRPDHLSGDEATSVAALQHVLMFLDETESYQPNLVVFLQCTSPIRTSQDIDRAIQQLKDEGADSLLSVVPSHRFLWRRSADGATAVNYDYKNRPRRQDREPEYGENGSIYIFKPWVLREHDNQLGGKISLFEMDYWSGFEIDDPEDLALCEWIIQRQKKSREGAKLPDPLSLVVFDFDGVFTDNRVMVHEDGREAIVASRGDGYGVRLLRQRGIPMMVISTETNPVVQARCDKLGLPSYHGVGDKKSLLLEIVAEKGIQLENVLFIGNDLNDQECLRLVGCSVVPADAHESVLAEADIVLSKPGGHGAIRELCDLILQREAS